MESYWADRSTSAVADSQYASDIARKRRGTDDLIWLESTLLVPSWILPARNHYYPTIGRATKPNTMARTTMTTTTTRWTTPTVVATVRDCDRFPVILLLIPPPVLLRTSVSCTSIPSVSSMRGAFLLQPMVRRTTVARIVTTVGPGYERSLLGNSLTSRIVKSLHDTSNRMNFHRTS